jgi:hypothetical protein
MDLLEWIYSNGSTRMDLLEWIYSNGSTRMDLLEWIYSNGSTRRVYLFSVSRFPAIIQRPVPSCWLKLRSTFFEITKHRRRQDYLSFWSKEKLIEPFTFGQLGRTTGDPIIGYFGYLLFFFIPTPVM